MRDERLENRERERERQREREREREKSSHPHVSSPTCVFPLTWNLSWLRMDLAPADYLCICLLLCLRVWLFARLFVCVSHQFKELYQLWFYVNRLESVFQHFANNYKNVINKVATVSAGNCKLLNSVDKKQDSLFILLKNCFCCDVQN